MGTGKTTISAALANKFNLKNIDTDLEIQKLLNMSISDIFALKGEDFFRKTESEFILNNVKNSDMIVSVGGGAFENNITREFLLKNTYVIYLQSCAETIFQRIKDGKSRPLLADNMSIENIKRIISNRDKHYKLAHYTICTDNKNIDTIVREITDCLSSESI